MCAIYRYMLWLYPEACRAEFAEEMLAVVSARAEDAGRDGMLTRMKFHGREVAGLLAGALDERLRVKAGSCLVLPIVWRRLAMRSSFRFPRAVAPMMLAVLALVSFTIARASSAAVKFTSPHLTTAGERFSLPLSVGLWLGTAYVVGAAVWFLIHTLHRSGAQRLSDIETWPQK
jgi:hypothetical protein